jgi:hypothetical protein
MERSIIAIAERKQVRCLLQGERNSTGRYKWFKFQPFPLDGSGVSDEKKGRRVSKRVDAQATCGVITNGLVCASRLLRFWGKSPGAGW